jgi:hypothetical protein
MFSNPISHSSDLGSETRALFVGEHCGGVSEQGVVIHRRLAAARHGPVYELGAGGRVGRLDDGVTHFTELAVIEARKDVIACRGLCPVDSGGQVLWIALLGGARHVVLELLLAAIFTMRMGDISEGLAFRLRADSDGKTIIKR